MLKNFLSILLLGFLWFGESERPPVEPKGYFGKGKWICTVAGAGKKPVCFKRP